MRIARAGEEEEVAHDAIEAVDLVVDDRRVLQSGCVRFELSAEGEGSRFKRGERVANFVCHSGGEDPERCELFVTLSERLGLDELRAKRRDHFTKRDSRSPSDSGKQDETSQRKKRLQFLQ